MIPYVIEQACSNEDCRESNIITSYGYCDKNDFDKEIIGYIIESMYEFCSEEYGHGIKITCYDDYCKKYWEDSGIYMYRNGYGYGDAIFNVAYFENDKWNHIDLESDEYKEKIYNSYVKKYMNS